MKVPFPCSKVEQELCILQISLWGQQRLELKLHPYLASFLYLFASSLHYSIPESTPY